MNCLPLPSKRSWELERHGPSEEPKKKKRGGQPKMASIALEQAHSRQMGFSGGKWVHSSLLAAQRKVDNKGFHSDTSYWFVEYLNIFLFFSAFLCKYFESSPLLNFQINFCETRIIFEHRCIPICNLKLMLQVNGLFLLEDPPFHYFSVSILKQDAVPKNLHHLKTRYYFSSFLRLPLKTSVFGD